MRFLIEYTLLVTGVLQFAACNDPTEQTAPDPFAAERAAAEQLERAFEADVRLPSRSNLSGVWRSGFAPSGYAVRLEQRGDAVDGVGYWSGCTGFGETFTVNGSYRDGILALHFMFRDGSPVEPCDYNLVDALTGLSLRGIRGGKDDILFPANELKRPEKSR